MNEAPGSESIVCPECACELAREAHDSSVRYVCGACWREFSRRGSSRLSRAAVVSLLLGIVSPLGVFVSGVPAILVGAIALRRIDRAEGTLRGRLAAYIGIGMGAISSVLAIAAVGAFALLFLFHRVASGDPLLQAETEWRWLHPSDGVDPAQADPDFHATFFQPEYDDSAWDRMAVADPIAASFGYGDEVAYTLPLSQPPEGMRHTAYFRVRFRTAQEYRELSLQLYHDDGVIVYLDGNEVARDNMTAAAEEYRLDAGGTVAEGLERRRHRLPLASFPLPPGDHVLAISLHNALPTSSDLGLGAVQLYGNP